MCEEYHLPDLKTARCKKIIKNFIVNDNPYLKTLNMYIDIWADRETLRISIFETKPYLEGVYHSIVAEFNFNSFPGTSIYLVSSGTYVNYTHQGKGIAQTLQKVKQYIAKELGVYYLICTTNGGNIKQNHILEKTGWKKINTVTSKVTGEKNLMWILEIEKEKEKND